MEKGLMDRQDYLKYKFWFSKTYPELPFMLHPNFVKEYNQAQRCLLCNIPLFLHGTCCGEMNAIKVY